MKKFVVAIAMCFMTAALFAQKGSVEANSREDLLAKIGVPTVYVLPEFEECFLYYKDGSMTKSVINVCAFDNSVRFTLGKDTLKLRSIDNVDYILSSQKKFVYRDGLVLDVLREGAEYSLAERKRLKISEPKQDSGYGAVPASSSAKTASSNDYATHEGHSYGYMVSVDYAVSYDYYLVSPEGEVIQAKKKAFIKAFPKIKDGINTVVKTRKIDFGKKEDIVWLYDYCLSVL